ncbi:hypothetical protein Taro_016510 [Colocasia esculenta]|uniref:Uncharacterized protein n=1 Tax=Colocasia esculenta TaxID=4460 RepID=A0A843UNP9_COLES|nr:hypothetical protein [Colocasia esculenta]
MEFNSACERGTVRQNKEANELNERIIRSKQDKYKRDPKKRRHALQNPWNQPPLPPLFPWFFLVLQAETLPEAFLPFLFLLPSHARKLSPGASLFSWLLLLPNAMASSSLLPLILLASRKFSGGEDRPPPFLFLGSRERPFWKSLPSSKQPFFSHILPGMPFSIAADASCLPGLLAHLWPSGHKSGADKCPPPGDGASEDRAEQHPQVMPVVLMPSASRPTENSGGLASYSGDANCVDAISFKTYGKLHRLGFIFRPTDDSIGLASYSGDASCVDAISFKTSSIWFHIQVTPVVSTSTASRPADDSVGLVSYSGDACCIDIISFKTSSVWFHIQVTPVVSTSIASRPTDDSVGLVSYSGDVNCVDAISFKNLSAWLHLLVLELVTCNELEWPTIRGNLFGDVGTKAQFEIMRAEEPDLKL